MALIPWGCAFMSFLRGLRLPGAKLTAYLVLIFGAVQLAKGNDWPHPSSWEAGSAGQVVFIVLAIATSVLTLLVVFSYRRLLLLGASRTRLDAAAKGFARLVEKQTALQRSEIGVNIWLVKGPKGFRRLVRAATEVPEPRAETPITWIKGKGSIGQAWARNRSRFADLDRMRAALPRLLPGTP